MNRPRFVEVLAASGAVVCFTLALAAPAVAADGISGVLGTGANNNTSTSSDPNANANTNANGNLCFGILAPAPCGSSSSAPTTAPPSTTPPAANPPAATPPAVTVNGNVNGTAGNGTAANGNVNVNASVGTGSDGSGTPANPCDNSSTSAGNSNPLSGDRSLLFGGGLASTLTAGALAVKRMRRGTL